MFQLFGSTTSPYVRRVRIAFVEAKTPYELIETVSPEGQARLREVSPLWKVPVLRHGDLVLSDSHVILEYLESRSAVPSSLVRPRSIEQKSLLAVVDGMLDSLIQRFYLLKDGVGEDVPYQKKQVDRASSVLTSLAVPPLSSGLGPEALYWGTALAWIRFRAAYPLERHPELLRWLDELEERPSFRKTVPA